MGRRTVLEVLVVLLLANSIALAQDDAADGKAKELKLLAAGVRKQLEVLSAEDADEVERGDALEAIALVGADLAALPIEGLEDRVREAGLTAKDRYIAVLAGEVLNHVDPAGTVQWLDKHVFGVKSDLRRRRMGLAILSEIPVEEAGRIAGERATQGSAETRVHALMALAKLGLPDTYGAMKTALGSQDKAVKDNAAIALGRLGDPRAIPAP
jgi:hypothetical protein